MLPIVACGGIPSAWAGGGDAAARSFAEYCRDELPAQRQKNFYAALDDAERALSTRDVIAAEEAVAMAWQAAFRGGGETDDGVRCLGEGATRRWFNTRLELWRQGSTAGMRGGVGADYTELYVVAADRDTDGVVEVAKNRPAEDFVWAYHSVEDIVEVDQWMREYGTLILPEETRIVAAARDALPQLQQYAKREHAATLAAEDAAFSRPMTQQERDAAAKLGGIGKLAESMAGMDIGTADQQQLLLINRQVDESFALLEKLRGFEVAPLFGYSNDPMPSAIRAEKRGDTLFARGNDASLGIEFRDELYNLAGRYYGFCSCYDKSDQLAKSRDAIQPALEALRSQQQEKMEKMQAEMEQRADAVRRDIEKMQKTDAEKKSFEEEADALEAELGF